MRIHKILFIAVLALGALTIQSCSETEGCTDVNATNYNSDATKDDGSCTYRGKVTFWNYSVDQIGVTTVTIDGQTGTISSDLTSISGPSSCTSCSGCANFTLKPGTYTYTAESTSYSWSGIVTITVNGCVKYRLTI